MHEVLWTQALLAEWERVTVRAERRSAASAAAITAAIRAYFGDSEVLGWLRQEPCFGRR